MISTQQWHMRRVYSLHAERWNAGECDGAVTFIEGCQLSTGTDAVRVRQFSRRGETTDGKEAGCQVQRNEYEGQIWIAAETVIIHRLTAIFKHNVFFESPDHCITVFSVVDGTVSSAPLGCGLFISCSVKMNE